MLFGDWSEFQQVFFKVGHETIQVFYSLLDALQNRANCEQLKCAAHWETFRAAMPKVHEIFRICYNHADLDLIFLDPENPWHGWWNTSVRVCKYDEKTKCTQRHDKFSHAHR